jgi:hypothetical protein
MFLFINHRVPVGITERQLQEIHFSCCDANGAPNSPKLSSPSAGVPQIPDIRYYCTKDFVERLGILKKPGRNPGHPQNEGKQIMDIHHFGKRVNVQDLVHRSGAVDENPAREFWTPKDWGRRWVSRI